MERRHGYMRQIHSKWTTKSPLSTAGRELECHSYFQHHYHIHCSSLQVKSRHTALCPVRKSFILLGFYYLFQNTPQSVHFQNNTQSHCILADYFSGRQIRLRLLWKCEHVWSPSTGIMHWDKTLRRSGAKSWITILCPFWSSAHWTEE